MDYESAIAEILALDDLPEKVPTTKERVYGVFNYILCKLSAREERILRMRSGVGYSAGQVLTIEEVAQLFSMTKKRAKEIEATALRKIEKMVKQIKV